MTATPLHARWLGTVPYREAEALQRAIHERTTDDYLLLAGASARLHAGFECRPRARLARSSRRSAPSSCKPTGVATSRITGRGSSSATRSISLAEWRAGQRDVVAYVRKLEEVLIARPAPTSASKPNARRVTPACGWATRKIAAIGVRVARGRTRHGFALNVDPDLSMFEHIVPCGILDRGVTSMARLLGRPVEMHEVVDRVVARFADAFGYDEVERQDVVAGTAGAARTGGRCCDLAHAQAAGMDARARAHRRRVRRAEAPRQGLRTCTPSAKKRAARTSTSAGLIAPRPS